MKIYLASGFTVCSSRERERVMYNIGTKHRLHSYFFVLLWSKGFLKFVKEKQNENRGIEENRRNFETSI
jgi:hypothetical protein